MLTCFAVPVMQAEDAVQQGVEEWNPKDDPHAQVDHTYMLLELRSAAVQWAKSSKQHHVCAGRCLQDFVCFSHQL